MFETADDNDEIVFEVALFVNAGTSFNQVAIMCEDIIHMIHSYSDALIFLTE